MIVRFCQDETQKWPKKFMLNRSVSSRPQLWIPVCTYWLIADDKSVGLVIAGLLEGRHWLATSELVCHSPSEKPHFSGGSWVEDFDFSSFLNTMKYMLQYIPEDTQKYCGRGI